jgi:hypothetical protein
MVGTADDIRQAIVQKQLDEKNAKRQMLHTMYVEGLVDITAQLLNLDIEKMIQSMVRNGHPVVSVGIGTGCIATKELIKQFSGITEGQGLKGAYMSELAELYGMPRPDNSFRVTMGYVHHGYMGRLPVPHRMVSDDLEAIVDFTEEEFRRKVEGHGLKLEVIYSSSSSAFKDAGGIMSQTASNIDCIYMRISLPEYESGEHQARSIYPHNFSDPYTKGFCRERAQAFIDQRVAGRDTIERGIESVSQPVPSVPVRGPSSKRSDSHDCE